MNEWAVFVWFEVFEFKFVFMTAFWYYSSSDLFKIDLFYNWQTDSVFLSFVNYEIRQQQTRIVWPEGIWSGAKGFRN